MNTNQALEHLSKKPLNAKYYAYDDNDFDLVSNPKLSLLTKLSHMMVYVLSFISKPYHRL
jgi:hypothetical protein